MKIQDLPQKLYILFGETLESKGEELILNGTGSSIFYEVLDNGRGVTPAWPTEETLHRWQKAKGHEGYAVEMDRDKLIEMLKLEPRINDVVYNPKPDEKSFSPTQCIPVEE